LRELSFAERLSEHRRISLLRTLASGPGYRANESLLQEMLESFGLACTRDQVRTELSWLRDQGFVVLDEIAGIYIARITAAGDDVAAGRTTVPGVRRPSATP
jgi:hypothetical protein